MSADTGCIIANAKGASDCRALARVKQLEAALLAILALDKKLKDNDASDPGFFTDFADIARDALDTEPE